ncbi:MAG TPA: tyrosine--tRNA ligase [Actinomycetota bacterium]
MTVDPGFFDDLRWRGLVHQWTGEDAFVSRLARGPITVYGGFDPSAESLHIGNLVQLMLLRRFQRAGHRPISVAGGATGMIGDPSGKSEERNLLGLDELEANLDKIKPQLTRFLDFETAENPAVLVNNATWLGEFGFLTFLREVGKHASVNVMLARESVKARLSGDAGISYAEFSYSLLQAYDFVHLNRELGCELQIGGSDQFGNIVAGIDLARRMHGVTLYGLTTPLITRSDGVKMGKTAEGAVWLDAARTSPYAFYQWFVRVPDADAGAFLRSLTGLSREEILALEEETAKAPAARAAQKRLAHEITLLVHGPDGLAAAERATAALFGGDLGGLSEADLLEIFADVPSVELARSRLGEGLDPVEALTAAGLARSNGDARRLLEAGGAYVNNRRVEPDRMLAASDLASETVMVLRAGKRTFALLRFV